MQETPPYTLLEIHVLLSQYLDGELEADEMLRLDALMEQFPQYRREFLKLQAVHGAIKGVSEHQDAPPMSDSLWSSIQERLQSDDGVPAAEWEPEWICAYFDGEQDSTTELFRQFEAQLYRHEEANRLLATFGDVSRHVRQFAVRLEHACSVDVAPQVMTLYRREEALEGVSSEAPEDGYASVLGNLSDEDLEALSAYVDEELSPREIISANRVIEQHPEARVLLGRFNRLSAQLQAFGARREENAPNVWPAVYDAFMASPEAVAQLAQQAQTRRRQHRFRVTAAIAAAVTLLLVSLPSMRQDVTPTVHAPVATASLPKEAALQTASLPVGSSVSGVQLASVTSSRSVPLEAASSSVRAPRTTSLRQLAVRPSEKPAHRPIAPLLSEARAAKSPSSESYLFQALSEQMPNEDVSAILGK